VGSEKVFENFFSVDFRFLLSLFWALFGGVISTLRILLPQKEPKIGQNNPENRRKEILKHFLRKCLRISFQSIFGIILAYFVGVVYESHFKRSRKSTEKRCSNTLLRPFLKKMQTTSCKKRRKAA